MKKIIVFISIVIIGISLNGCSDLDTYPGNSLNQNIFWKTESHAKEALMGVYSVLRAEHCYGQTHWINDVLGSIYATRGGMQGIQNGTYNDRNGTILAKWQKLYDGVQKSNHVISNVSNMSSLSDDTKAAYIAEAKFLRALFYFNLLDFFGGVPYYDETTDINKEYATLLKPRSSADEIRSHILSDLNEAVSKLPPTWDAVNYGRATKGAAYALRGKVYLYNKEWKNAIADFEEVVNNKSNNYGYALDPDYARIFKLYDGAKSTEMVFSVQNKGGSGNPYGMPMNNFLGNRGSYGSGQSYHYPSVQLVDMYENTDGSPFNWDDIHPGYNASVEKREEFLCVETEGGVIVGMRSADTAKVLNAYRNRDPRLMAVAIVPYANYAGWVANAPKNLMIALDGTKPGVLTAGTLYWDLPVYTGYFCRKFVAEGNLGGSITSRDHTPFEFPVIRYADVLLMLAEAYNEDGQLDKAILEFNKVRARVNMPGLNSGAAWMAVTSKEQMAARIRKERAFEFAGEGLRFSDVRRWGFEIAREEITGKGDAVNIYGSTLYLRKFTERDMLWPIPATEREMNPELAQNPGW